MVGTDKKFMLVMTDDRQRQYIHKTFGKGSWKKLWAKANIWQYYQFYYTKLQKEVVING